VTIMLSKRFREIVKTKRPSLCSVDSNVSTANGKHLMIEGKFNTVIHIANTFTECNVMVADINVVNGVLGIDILKLVSILIAFVKQE